MMSSDEINEWCKRMEQCTFDGSDEIEISRVNRLVSEFRQFHPYEQDCIIAWCCGQLTGHRMKIRDQHYAMAELVKNG